MSRLTGFPNTIKVILGSGWIGTLGLDASDVLLLHFVSESGTSFQDRYHSEDGTATAGASNRIRFKARSILLPDTVSGIVAEVDVPNASTTSFWNLGAVQTLQQPYYEFLDLFNATVFDHQSWQTTVNGRNWLTAAYASDYNSDIFSSLSAAQDQDLNVVNGETNVPHSSGEIDLGSVAVDADAPTVTLTLENTGDLALTLDSLSFSGGDAAKFSVASGSTWDGAADTEIAADASTDVTLEMDTSEAGEFTATVSIASDDPASPYTFTISGTVLAAGSSSRRRRMKMIGAI